MKIKDERNHLGVKTSHEELFDDERRRHRSANPRVRVTRGGQKPRMVARAGVGRRWCRWRRAWLMTATALDGGGAGVAEAALRGRRSCRAG
jgi:hypothetical protein